MNREISDNYLIPLYKDHRKIFMYVDIFNYYKH